MVIFERQKIALILSNYLIGTYGKTQFKKKKKTTMKYRLTLVRMAIIKNLQTINAGEGVKKMEPSYTVGGSIN